MVKLPDYTALGQGSQPQPSGMTPSYSTQGFSPRLTGGGAEGLQQLANTFGQIAEREKNKADTLQGAQAEADFTIASARLYNDFGKSKDYERAPGEFRDAVGGELERAASGISDRTRRELFIQRHRGTIERQALTLTDHYWKQYGSEVVAKNDDRFTELAREGLTNPDPAYRAQVLDNVRTIIQGEVEAGYLTPAQAKTRQRAFVEKYAEAWVKTLPPEEARKLLEPYVSSAPRAEARNPRAATQLPAGQDGSLDVQEQPSPAPTGGAQNVGPASGVIEAAARSAGVNPGLMLRFAKIESGGNPNAVTGSYKGLFQLSDSEFKKYGGGNIFNPEDNAKAAAKKIAAESAEFKRAYGRDPTATDLYLIHQQGVAGYRAHMTNPDAPAWQNMLSTGEGQQKGEKWAKAAIWGNVPDQLKGQYGSVENISSAQFVALWDRRVSGGAGVSDIAPRARTGTLADFLPPDRIPALYEGATRLLLEQRTAASTNRYDEISRLVIDGKSGNGPMPPRDLIENDPILLAEKKNALLKEYDAADKEAGVLRIVAQKFSDPQGGAFNPYNTDERKAVDKIYGALGGAEGGQKATAALERVVERTGTVPDAVALQIRGGLSSSNPQMAQNALQTAANLITRNPQVFAGAQGEKEIEQAAVKYRHYVDGLGMSAGDATKKWIESQTPEYKAKVRAIVKGEDVNKIIKDKLSINDLRGGFDQVPWIPFTDPNIGFGHKQRQAMYSTYVESWREHFDETGNVDEAKKLALNDVKKVWGVSKVNGSSVVIPYPPEKSPGFANVPDASTVIGNQAIAAIKAEHGVDVTRDKIVLQSIPGLTAQAYKAGQQTPYQLMWVDKNGVLQSLNPGRAFAPDANQAVVETQMQRQSQFETERTGIQSSMEARQTLQTALIQKRQRAAARRQSAPVIAGGSLAPGGPAAELNIE